MVIQLKLAYVHYCSKTIFYLPLAICSNVAPTVTTNPAIANIVGSCIISPGPPVFIPPILGFPKNPLSSSP